MCSLAFFAFLRIGEITTKRGNGLQLHQLAYICDSGNQVVGIYRVNLSRFKHNYNQRPFTLSIKRQAACCPIQLLLDYLALRGKREGAIFMTQGGTPVTREPFAVQLSETIRLCGLNPNRYKGHSFRIGAASHAQGRVCQIPKFVSWAVGSPTLFSNIFAFHHCPHTPLLR